MSARTTTSTLTIASLLMAVGCGSSSNGSITSTSSDEDVAIGVLVSTGLGLLSTTGGAIITDETDQGPPSARIQDRRAIEIALARGHGAWIADLADEIRLPEGLVGHLGAALKANRAPLSALLADPELEVGTWRRRLADALCCDRWLYPFAHRRFRCRAPDEAGTRGCPP